MSAARLDKLRALLKRVEERKAQPRLRAVPSAAPQPAAVAAPLAKAPPDDDELSFDTVPPAAQPVSAPPAAAASGQPAPSQPARTPVPSRPAATSPIEDALAQLPEPVEDSGPLQVQALAEPITTPERDELDERDDHDTEPPPPPPAGFDPHVMVTHRPEAKLSLPDIELIGAPAAPTFVQAGPTFVPPSGGREPTLEFATGPKAAPRAIEVGTSEPILLQAPSATIEASLPNIAQAARAVSQVRIDAPKSFGELLELSLSLRPR